jgi:hypothetical protein
LWKEEDKVLKPLNSNVARVNLVNEATGSGIPNLITISAVDQSLFGFYIDPIETGLVALDEPMKTSLGLAWAVCQNDLLRWANKPNKSKASMNTRLGLVWEFCRHGFPGWARNSKKSKITSTNPVVLPAIRLNLPIGSLRLTGDSASGMIAVAMLVTASGGTLDTDRTCSFAIRLNKRKES